jgi:hypothetical protein
VTLEFVLLLGLYAFILFGALLGDKGPIQTFQNSAPQLAARIEKDISVGRNFQNKKTGQPITTWQDPKNAPGSGE